MLFDIQRFCTKVAIEAKLFQSPVDFRLVAPAA